MTNELSDTDLDLVTAGKDGEAFALLQAGRFRRIERFVWRHTAVGK